MTKSGYVNRGTKKFEDRLNIGAILRTTELQNLELEKNFGDLLSLELKEQVRRKGYI